MPECTDTNTKALQLPSESDVDQESDWWENIDNTKYINYTQLLQRMLDVVKILQLIQEFNTICGVHENNGPSTETQE